MGPSRKKRTPSRRNTVSEKKPPRASTAFATTRKKRAYLSRPEHSWSRPGWRHRITPKKTSCWNGVWKRPVGAWIFWGGSSRNQRKNHPKPTARKTTSTKRIWSLFHKLLQPESIRVTQKWLR